MRDRPNDGFFLRATVFPESVMDGRTEADGATFLRSTYS